MAENCFVAPVAIDGLRGVSEIDVSVAAVTVSVVDPDMLPDPAVIVVEPAATGVATPLEPAALLIVATPVLDELQVTDVVRFRVEPSEYVPVAVNCWVVPLATLGLAGVTARETSVAGVTVRVVDPDMLPDPAVIVVEPAAAGVATPLEPAALLIVATPVLEELQVTDVVRFWVELSEYVPVAVNCWVVPLTTLGLVGVTARETSVAGVTVRVVDAVMLPDTAEIVVEPAATEEADPLEPAELLIVAAPELEELQVTDVVRSWVELSEKVPMAVNCSLVPLAMLGLVGVMARDTRVACVTVIVVDPDVPPDVAVMVD